MVNITQQKNGPYACERSVVGDTGEQCHSRSSKGEMLSSDSRSYVVTLLDRNIHVIHPSSTLIEEDDTKAADWCSRYIYPGRIKTKVNKKIHVDTFGESCQTLAWEVQFSER